MICIVSTLNDHFHATKTAIPPRQTGLVVCGNDLRGENFKDISDLVGFCVFHSIYGIPNASGIGKHLSVTKLRAHRGLVLPRAFLLNWPQEKFQKTSIHAYTR